MTSPEGSDTTLPVRERVLIVLLMLSLTACVWMPILGAPAFGFPLWISGAVAVWAIASLIWQLRIPIRRWKHHRWLLRNGIYTKGTVVAVRRMSSLPGFFSEVIEVLHSGSVLSEISYRVEEWEGAEVGEEVALFADPSGYARDGSVGLNDIMVPKLHWGFAVWAKYQKEHALPGSAT